MANAKQLFKSAYGAARKAAEGRAIQAYPGESIAKANAETVWNAAYNAASFGVYMNGEGFAAVKAASCAAVRALAVSRKTAGKTLGERLDIFRIERDGGYFYG